MARERLAEQRDISARNMRTWVRETREDLARYRANASQSLQVTVALVCLANIMLTPAYVCVDWEQSKLEVH